MPPPHQPLACGSTSQGRHPRDSRIEFNEATHTYTIDGSSQGVISVTSLIGKFFEPFDADQVIQRMMAGPKFSEGPYAGMTPTGIKNKWKEDGNAASQAGTALHKKIELFYGSPGPVSPLENQGKDWEYFLQFHNEIIIPQGLEPYRSEWSIFISKAGVAGQLDMLFKKGDTFVLCDWKRAKSIDTENKWKTALTPLEHMPDCNFSKYSLQLNLYKYILEKYYDIPVHEMYIVVFHPTSQGFRQFQVPTLHAEIKKMLGAYKRSKRTKHNKLNL